MAAPSAACSSELRPTIPKATRPTSSNVAPVGLRDITNIASARGLPGSKAIKRPLPGSHQPVTSEASGSSLVSVPAWAAPGPPMPPPSPAAAPAVFVASTGLAEGNLAAQGTFAGLASLAAPLAPPTHQGAMFPVAVQPAGAPEEMSSQTLGNELLLENSVQMVAEYAPAIFDRLFASEQEELRPDPGYIRDQADINLKMRAILVDWLVEVHLKYKLRQETLFLSVSLIDRYLARVQVPRNRLQLVGVAAMFVASKFEDITPPQVAEFVYITDNAYTQEDVRRAEVMMLTELNFNVVVPTPAHFVDRLLRANGSDGIHTELVGYLLELSLLDLHMIRHHASLLSAAAVLLGNYLLRRTPSWPAALAQMARYSELALRECVEEMRALFEAAPNSGLQAIRKKYAQPRRLSVSTVIWFGNRM